MQFNSPLRALVSAIQVTILFFLQWNVFEHGFTTYSLLNILFLFSFAFVVITSIVKSKLFQRKFHLGLICLCGLALIPFICLWCFASDDISYRPMMLVSISLLYIFTAILADRWIEVKYSNLAGLMLALIVFNNSIIANISYNYMHLCNQNTFAESIEMMTRIHDLQAEYEIADIAILGNRSAEVQLIPAEQSPAGNSAAASSFIISSGLEKSLLYDDDHTRLYLENVHSLDLPAASSEKLEKLAQSAAVQEMEIWPSRGSIQVIESTLVIKLENINITE